MAHRVPSSVLFRDTHRRISPFSFRTLLQTTQGFQALGALSVQLGVPATRLNGFTVSQSAVQALPEKVARKHLAVPLQKIGTMLQVAIASPTDLAALDDLRFASGCQIQTFVALENEIVSALDRFYIEGTLETTPEDDSESVLIEAVPIERRDPSRPDRRRGRKKADQNSEGG